MGLGIWVRIGWFQLPRKKGEGSERERRAWPGQQGPAGPSSCAGLCRCCASVRDTRGGPGSPQRASPLGLRGKSGTLPRAS